MVVLGFGCGTRSLPFQEDGRAPDAPALHDSASTRDRASTHDAISDACLRPPTLGCESSSVCPEGAHCGGCFPDPCCPECSACYPMCLPGCLDNGDCEDSDYCHAESCALDAGQPGLCLPRPVGCFDDYNPMCGCDERTHPNACHAQADGVNVAYPGECRDTSCDDVACTVANDCCVCDAFVGEGAPVCDAICDSPQCTTQGFWTPIAYCLQGKCFLTDERLLCYSDKHCQLQNDCCRCAALHTSIKPAECPASCFVSMCTAMGMPEATAVCDGRSQTCRLVE